MVSGIYSLYRREESACIAFLLADRKVSDQYESHGKMEG